MCGLLAILAASSAHAQTINEQTANVPFSFTVGNKTFPAGEYRVSRLNPQASQAAIVIKSTDGRLSKITLTNDILSNGVQDTAKLVFTRYADHYFLAEVWMRTSDNGLSLPRSSAERALVKSMKDERPEQQIVALTSRRQ